MSETIEYLKPITGELIAPRPRSYPEPPVDYEESDERLRDVGLDEILALVEEGHSEREICKRIGTRASHLKRWITSIPEGETRARESRKRGAQAWLDRALAAIEDAEGLAELAKARELATICRKYAAILDPAFSDRVQVDTTIKAEDPGSIDAKLRLLVAQVAQNTIKSDK